MKSALVQVAVLLAFLALSGCGNPQNQGSQKSESQQNTQNNNSQNNPHVGNHAHSSNTQLIDGSKNGENKGANSAQTANGKTNNISDAASPNTAIAVNPTNQINQTTRTTAKLISPANLSSTQGVPLEFKVQNQAGQAVENFDTPQEKPMHLVVVSDDLRFFEHVHPNYQGQGKFAINHNFPSPGTYTLFTDYKPSGSNEQVSAEKISIPGKVPIPDRLESFADTQTVENTNIKLQLTPGKLTAGKNIKFSFNLTDTTKKQPVADLQTYLGKQAHLVIIRSSSPLTATDYIHAHPLNSSNPSSPNPGKIEFQSQFPQKGTYKIWLQFQRNGKIATAPFWLNVN